PHGAAESVPMTATTPAPTLLCPGDGAFVEPRGGALSREPGGVTSLLSHQRERGRAGNDTPCGRTGRGSAAGHALGQVGDELVDADSVLPHRVALAHRDRLVVQRLEVDGHAVRGADLVLAAVPAADRARVIEVGVPVLAHVGRDVPGLR